MQIYIDDVMILESCLHVYNYCQVIIEYCLDFVYSEAEKSSKWCLHSFDLAGSSFTLLANKVAPSCITVYAPHNEGHA